MTDSYKHFGLNKNNRSECVVFFFVFTFHPRREKRTRDEMFWVEFPEFD